MKSPSDISFKMNIAELSQLTKIERRTVSTRLLAQNVPFETGPKNSKLYEVHLALPAIYQKENNDAESQAQQQNEKLLLLVAKRQKAELELDERRRKLIAVDQVLDVVEKEYTFIRSRFRALPSSLSKHLAIQTDPKAIFEILTNSINEVLAELQADADTQLAEIPEQPELTKSENSEELENEQ